MSDTFTIRPIRPADEAAMAAVIRAVMPEFGADGPGFAIHDPEVDTLHGAYEVPGRAYFVVEKDGRVMGGAGIAPLDGQGDGTCELRKMYFLRELRGLGAGHALMARCLEAARAMDYTRCYIETLTGMDGAKALYLKSGFTPIAAPLGDTGHFACDRYYLRELA
ncbi:GNAT family N-acetyltransferase [Oleiagrimonas sp. C23AA]|uniref:GNAT family N-acetyltransferase n=1 Tax=Oleiagrimonas sp. C23AA TaxID=2719047 RepID=UPI001420B3AE|nr:GNAT family N-acetyltransferase [Oleiagrimonas sp. C23AA]NII09348.1 GNAT family N-acetyltransferase [Oleiagrimonas sp. C23AA]